MHQAKTDVNSLALALLVQGCGYKFGNLLACLPHRILGQMCVALRRRSLTMPEKPSDVDQGKAACCSDTCIGVAQIMKAHVIEPTRFESRSMVFAN